MAKVLVTGAAGAVGQPVCRALLEAGHEVVALDRAPVENVEHSLLGNIADEATMLKAAKGVEVIVHLAAYPNDAPFSTLLEPNVQGLYQVFNAARVHAVPKVILASSIQVLGKRAASAGPARVTDASPDNHYGLTKYWAEAMGGLYARRYGIAVLAVRIAWMVRNVGEAEHMQKMGRFDIYLSTDDTGRFFRRAVEAELSGFEVVYAVSRGGERLFDLEPAKRLLGYEPTDRWPEGLGFPFSPEGSVP